jgi:hypothetical protein
VRQQNGVNAARVGRRRAAPAEVKQPPAQQGVGEEPDPAELDEHGGVADPGQSRWSRYAAAPRLSSASCSAASCSFESEL